MSYGQSFLTIILLASLLAGCENEQNKVPSYQVESKAFSIEVDAFGEIEAADAQRIVSPGTQPMTLSWLMEENTYVEAGQVIAKFDAQSILRDSRNEEFEMLKLQEELTKNQAIQYQQQKEIQADQNFVKQEFDFVDRFAIDDLRIYSQLEIIDTLQNRDFLEAKDDFYDWKESSINEQHSSEIAVLDIRKRGHQAKYQRFKQALSQLEVVAPYAGLLIYEKDRRGEKPSVGQTIFPGRPIASIPNLDNLRARMFVQANEAIDLAIGQSIVLTMQAFPERSFEGELTNVAGFPRSIERNNPVTYYEIEASIKEQDKTIMQPGRKVDAKILVKPTSQMLTVPLQALFHEDGMSYVYVQSSQGFVRQNVTTGRKNLFSVVVTDGLNDGDVIALSQPDPADAK